MYKEKLGIDLNAIITEYKKTEIFSKISYVKFSTFSKRQLHVVFHIRP